VECVACQQNSIKTLRTTVAGQQHWFEGSAHGFGESRQFLNFGKLAARIRMPALWPFFQRENGRGPDLVRLCGAMRMPYTALNSAVVTPNSQDQRKNRDRRKAALRSIGYEAVWVGEGSWNGVAILARGRVPILTRSALPGDDHDHQTRYVGAAVRGVLIGCIYLPNGNPQPGPKCTYKLAWFERLIVHANDLITAGVPVLVQCTFRNERERTGKCI
jgi:hypothetical protein